MLAPNFPVWVSKSLAYHFDTALGNSYNFIVEGEKKKTEEVTERIELRIDGPIMQELSNGSWYITVEVNFLVITPSGQNVYKPQQICGDIAANCTGIVLYKIDDAGNIGTQLGCLSVMPQLRDNIDISHFGQIQPDVPIMQSTVEVHYHMNIKENTDNGTD